MVENYLQESAGCSEARRVDVSDSVFEPSETGSFGDHPGCSGWEQEEEDTVLCCVLPAFLLV